MNTSTQNQNAFLHAFRAMEKKGDADLCLASLEFAVCYTDVRSKDYRTLRAEFYAKLATGLVNFYGETSVQMYPDCWIHLADSNIVVCGNPKFCSISKGDRDMVGDPMFGTIQQALGYILARHW